MPINIPDWQPLQTNFSSIPKLFIEAAKARAQEDSLRQNAETQAQYAKNQDRKLSADIARQAWQDSRTYNEDVHKRELEAGGAVAPGSPLMRAAGMPDADPGLLNIMGKPHGVSFDNTMERQWPEYKDAVSGADAAKFLTAGGVPRPARGQDPLLGPETRPLEGPTPGGAPINEAIHDLSPGDQPLSVDTETANRATAETRHMYATMRGQRFEVKPHNAQVFAEPEYNTLYNQQLADGADPEHARDNVAAIRKADIGELGRNTRHDADLGFKNEQLGSLDAYRGKSLALQDLNNRRNNAAKLAAARLIGMGMNEKTAVSLIGQYRQYSDSAQRSALMKQDQQGMRMEDRIAAELDPNSPNALNHQMANHSLAALSVSTGGSAGRVPVSVIHDVRNAYSAALSAKNWAYKQFHDGENLPEVVQLMTNAVAKLKMVSQAQRESDFRSWDHRAGYGSAWARSPETRGLVDSDRAMVREQLGLPSDEGLGPDTTGDPNAPFGGAATSTPSTPQATPPRSSKRAAAPPAAPAAHPAEAPVGTVKPGPDGRQMTKVGPNNWQPVTP